MSEIFAVTRGQLVDALTRLDISVPVDGPAAGMINAESMADAIIEALAPPPPPVHYRWPPQCASEIAEGETWTGAPDRVTCPGCLTAEGSPA